MTSEELPKFPKLIADDTTNEQKIMEWRREMAEKLEELAKIKEIHGKKHLLCTCGEAYEIIEKLLEAIR